MQTQRTPIRGLRRYVSTQLNQQARRRKIDMYKMDLGRELRVVARILDKIGVESGPSLTDVFGTWRKEETVRKLWSISSISLRHQVGEHYYMIEPECPWRYILWDEEYEGRNALRKMPRQQWEQYHESMFVGAFMQAVRVLEFPPEWALSYRKAIDNNLSNKSKEQWRQVVRSLYAATYHFSGIDAYTDKQIEALEKLIVVYSPFDHIVPTYNDIFMWYILHTQDDRLFRRLAKYVPPRVLNKDFKHLREKRKEWFCEYIVEGGRKEYVFAHQTTREMVRAWIQENEANCPQEIKPWIDT